MANDAVAEGARYWAFISYSHKDAGFGRRLHRRLEAYRLPRRLVGRVAVGGPVPKRIAPIFRDREEFAAANDLSAEVRAALQASRSLVVVCSPDAAASEWVSREVELFRALHPDRPVLAAIRSGEPPDVIPEPLRHTRRDGTIVEPLAADFRRGKDGVQLGLLKLVAGVVGIGLDELVQRDSSRRLQRVMAVTVVAFLAVLTMSALTWFAFDSRAEAERQRGEAEGLVEFMLTDLRDRLKGVGRLDVLTAVNQRALRYYADQDLDSLPTSSLERRARILHAMGEDDETRGDTEAALAKFQEAKRTTAALLAASPNDPERIFNYAQTVFWIGSVDYQRNHFAAATAAFLAYKHLADRLVAIAPSNPVYQREVGYAEVNLCAVALSGRRNPSAAVRYCSDALVHDEKMASRSGESSDNVNDVINGHAWLADAYRFSGNLGRARVERLAEEKLLDRQIASDPKNMELKDSWVATQRALATLDQSAGNKAAAKTRLENVLKTVDAMIRLDPVNQRWRWYYKQINGALNTLH